METRPRKTRIAWDEPGHAHYLTYSCFQRWPLLTRDRTRRWVVESLACVRQELDVQLWAYVIMPEHVHVLIYPNRDDYKMRTILAALKRPVSSRAKDHLERSGALDWLQRLTVKCLSREVFWFWQPGGGFDHNIFKEKTVARVIEYIH